jgi:hypothetical protein
VSSVTDQGAGARLQRRVRISGLATLILLAGCSPDLSKVCPYKATITQGVFGAIVDATNTVEENVQVDLYTITNGVQDATPAVTGMTTRAGYQYNVDPSTYVLCAKGVCTTVTVPTGLVELSAADASAGLIWNAPVAVPPAQTIGACTWGN